MEVAPFMQKTPEKTSIVRGTAKSMHLGGLGGRQRTPFSAALGGGIGIGVPANHPIPIIAHAKRLEIEPGSAIMNGPSGEPSRNWIEHLTTDQKVAGSTPAGRIENKGSVMIGSSRRSRLFSRDRLGYKSPAAAVPLSLSYPACHRQMMAPPFGAGPAQFAGNAPRPHLPGDEQSASADCIQGYTGGITPRDVNTRSTAINVAGQPAARTTVPALTTRSPPLTQAQPDDADHRPHGLHQP